MISMTCIIFQLEVILIPYRCRWMMVIDTGTSVSVISMEEHQRRWPGVALPTTDIRLRTYTSEQLNVLGARNANVQYGQQQATLPLVVVAAKGPCLLGRDWLCHLCLDWPSICHIENVSLQEILTRHSEVFYADLGTMQGYRWNQNFAEQGQYLFPYGPKYNGN